MSFLISKACNNHIIKRQVTTPRVKWQQKINTRSRYLFQFKIFNKVILFLKDSHISKKNLGVSISRKKLRSAYPHLLYSKYTQYPIINGRNFNKFSRMSQDKNFNMQILKVIIFRNFPIFKRFCNQVSSCIKLL